MMHAATPQRIFITGGSGYVGRNLIRYCTGAGIDVVALARSDRAAAVVRALGATPYRGDLGDGHLAAGMAGCDALVHAAADTGHGAASAAQQLVNEQGTQLVFAAAQRAGVRRAVHLSTESVLATGRPLVRVDETAPLPRTPAGGYARSKAAAEAAALACNGDGLHVVVLRPRFVWGRDDTTALPQLLRAARAGQLAWIAGGHYLTDSTHIGNLCHAVLLGLRLGRGGAVYFISDGDPVPFRTLITALLATQGVVVPDKSVPRALVRAMAALGDVVDVLSRGRLKPPINLQTYAASAVEVTLDIGKARRELGYAPVVTREQGLHELRALARAAQA